IVPEYCLPPPADLSPFLGKPVSSKITTPFGAPNSSPTKRWCSSIHPSSSQGESLKNSCSFRGGAHTSSAMFSTFFRSIGNSKPIRYFLLHCLPSERQKNP